jgi:hypothetical protein
MPREFDDEIHPCDPVPPILRILFKQANLSRQHIKPFRRLTAMNHWCQDPDGKFQLIWHLLSGTFAMFQLDELTLVRPVRPRRDPQVLRELRRFDLAEIRETKTAKSIVLKCQEVGDPKYVTFDLESI